MRHYTSEGVNFSDYVSVRNAVGLFPGDAGYIAAADATGEGMEISSSDADEAYANFDQSDTGFVPTI